MKQLGFITGLPRSGTGWLATMFSQIPNVCCFWQGRFYFRDCINSLYDELKEGIRPWYTWIAHRKMNWIQSEDIIKTVGNRNWISEEDLENKFDKDMEEMMARIVPYFMLKAAKDTDELIINKDTVRHPGTLIRLVNSLPEAKVIFLKRDIKETLMSSVLTHLQYKTNGGIGIDPFTEADLIQTQKFIEGKVEAPLTKESMVKHITRMLKVIAEAEEIALENPNFMILNYESLRKETMLSLSKILNIFFKFPVKQSDIDKAIMSTGGYQHKKHARKVGNITLDGSPGNLTKLLGEDINKEIDKILKEWSK